MGRKRAGSSKSRKGKGIGSTLARFASSGAKLFTKANNFKNSVKTTVKRLNNKIVGAKSIVPAKIKDTINTIRNKEPAMHEVKARLNHVQNLEKVMTNVPEQHRPTLEKDFQKERAKLDNSVKKHLIKRANIEEKHFKLPTHTQEINKSIAQLKDLGMMSAADKAKWATRNHATYDSIYRPANIDATSTFNTTVPGTYDTSKLSGIKPEHLDYYDKTQNLRRNPLIGLPKPDMTVHDSEPLKWAKTIMRSKIDQYVTKNLARNPTTMPSDMIKSSLIKNDEKRTGGPIRETTWAKKRPVVAPPPQSAELIKLINEKLAQTGQKKPPDQVYRDYLERKQARLTQGQAQGQGRKRRGGRAKRSARKGAGFWDIMGKLAEHQHDPVP